jgi:hypothetical protein
MEISYWICLFVIQLSSIDCVKFSLHIWSAIFSWNIKLVFGSAQMFLYTSYYVQFTFPGTLRSFSIVSFLYHNNLIYWRFWRFTVDAFRHVGVEPMCSGSQVCSWQSSWSLAILIYCVSDYTAQALFQYIKPVTTFICTIHSVLDTSSVRSSGLGSYTLFIFFKENHMI